MKKPKGKIPELLAPAGNFSKLKTALHFGADAVYAAGKDFSLRAKSDNFTEAELSEAVAYTHALGKKIYIACNVFAKNKDFPALKPYLMHLHKIGVDAVIVSDPGMVLLCRETVPELNIHLSTQANTCNFKSVEFWKKQGVKRVVLARELCLDEVREIAEYTRDMETEIFVHGAMCVSYSGRCLLSNYLADRDSNRGDCVQACRWKYVVHEVSRSENPLEMQEDSRGTYLLNSKDLNLLPILDRVVSTGVNSLKIEGRMKSEYYVASVVNAYRRALDGLKTQEGGYVADAALLRELEKTSHRQYTSAFAEGENAETICYETSLPKQEYKFIATVLGYDKQKGMLKVEMRNRFRVGDTLEALSPRSVLNRKIRVERMTDEAGIEITDAKLVQQVLYISTPVELEPLDILRAEAEQV